MENERLKEDNQKLSKLVPSPAYLTYLKIKERKIEDFNEEYELDLNLNNEGDSKFLIE